MTNIEYLQSRLSLLLNLFPSWTSHIPQGLPAVRLHEGRAVIDSNVSGLVFYLDGYRGPFPRNDVRVPSVDRWYTIIDTTFVKAAQGLVTKQLETLRPRDTFERRYRQVLEAMLACAVTGPEDRSIRDV